METKERKKKNTIPIRENSGKCVVCLETKFGGKKYDTQFISTEKKKKPFIHAMHTLAVDVMFTDMTAKKSIKRHG